jgi:hypothetical protein
VSAQTSTLLTGSLQIYDSSGTLKTSLIVKKSNYQYEFTINTNFPVAQECTVKITFPDEIILPTSTAGMSLSGSNFLAGASSLSVTGQIISFSACSETAGWDSEYLRSGTIKVTGIDTPGQVKTADGFDIKIYELSTSNLLAQGTKS